MPTDEERRKLLSLCRAVMPGVSGVVLSTLAGVVVAHEPVADPHALAREAAADRGADTSTLVERDGGLYLVVFVPASAAPIPA